MLTVIPTVLDTSSASKHSHISKLNTTVLPGRGKETTPTDANPVLVAELSEQLISSQLQGHCRPNILTILSALPTGGLM